MSFRRREHPEILDNLLTNMVDGVAAEPHPFPASDNAQQPHSYPLQRPPVKAVVSVFGSVNGKSNRFVKDTDYVLSEDGMQLLWNGDGQLPDQGSIFYVNYLPKDSTYNYSDLHVGSVMRTVTEAVSLEMARVYAQMEGVYDSGFIDSANGSALENVISLLGINRIQAGRFSGEIEFTRVEGSRGEIYIPAGTRVINADGSVEYETLTSVTLIDGQKTVRAVARDREENSEGMEAGTLTVMAKPIAGISAVNNPAPTSLTQKNESDDELRTRAKNFLHGSERATLGSIKEAVHLQGIQADVLEEEKVDELGRSYKTGVVQVIPHAEELAPDQRQRVLTAIEQSKPVGVTVRLAGELSAPAKIDLSLRVKTSSQLLENQIKAAHASLRSALKEYFDTLPIKEAGSVNKLIGLILNIGEIDDVEIVSAQVQGEGAPLDLTSGHFSAADITTRLGNLEIVDSNLPTHVNVLVSYPVAAELPNQNDIENAINQMIAGLNESSLQGAPLIDNLSKSLLLFILPLPIDENIKPQGLLNDFEGLLTVPDNSSATPYEIEFIFAQQNGLSQIVALDGDHYQLKPFEQLSLASVELVEKE